MRIISHNFNSFSFSRLLVAMLRYHVQLPYFVLWFKVELDKVEILLLHVKPFYYIVCIQTSETLMGIGIRYSFVSILNSFWVGPFSDGKRPLRPAR